MTPSSTFWLITCPPPFGDQVLFVNVGDGYCLLHQDVFTPNYPDVGSGMTLIGPVPPGQVEPVVVTLGIQVFGPVGGMSTQDFADAQISAAEIPGNPAIRGTVGIAGQEAVTAVGIPGIMGTLMAYLVHDGVGYTFVLFPWDDAVPAEKALAEQLWLLVTGTFTWLP